MVSYRKATELFRFAADNGHADAQYELGVFLLYGKMGFGGLGEKYLVSVPQNVDESIEWLTKAANQGHVLAMHKLGGVYDSSDKAKAFHFYSKAFKAGHNESLGKLFKLYRDTLDDEENIINNMWLDEAQKFINNEAAKNKYLQESIDEINSKTLRFFIPGFVLQNNKIVMKQSAGLELKLVLNMKKTKKINYLLSGSPTLQTMEK